MNVDTSSCTPPTVTTSAWAEPGLRQMAATAPSETLCRTAPDRRLEKRRIIHLGYGLPVEGAPFPEPHGPDGPQSPPLGDGLFCWAGLQAATHQPPPFATAGAACGGRPCNPAETKGRLVRVWPSRSPPCAPRVLSHRPVACTASEHCGMGPAPDCRLPRHHQALQGPPCAAQNSAWVQMG